MDLFFYTRDNNLYKNDIRVMSLEQYPSFTQDYIIDILNDNIDRMVIIEKPLNKEIIFVIDGNVFLHKYESKYCYTTKLIRI